MTNKMKNLCIALLLATTYNANAQTKPATDFERIFQSISAKNALTTSFKNHLKKMQPSCSERQESDPDFLRKGNVMCTAQTGIVRLTLSGSAAPAVTMIDATVTGTEKCEYMRSELIRQYGKPRESKGNCDSKWRIRRGPDKPLVHITLEKNDKKNIVYFDNNEEQGP